MRCKCNKILKKYLFHFIVHALIAHIVKMRSLLRIATGNLVFVTVENHLVSSVFTPVFCVRMRIRKCMRMRL